MGSSSMNGSPYCSEHNVRACITERMTDCDHLLRLKLLSTIISITRLYSSTAFLFFHAHPGSIFCPFPFDTRLPTDICSAEAELPCPAPLLVSIMSSSANPINWELGGSCECGGDSSDTWNPLAPCLSGSCCCSFGNMASDSLSSEDEECICESSSRSRGV